MMLIAKAPWSGSRPPVPGATDTATRTTVGPELREDGVRARQRGRETEREREGPGAHKGWRKGVMIRYTLTHSALLDAGLKGGEMARTPPRSDSP